MDEYTRIWKQILEEISKNVTSVDYDMWFSKLEPISINFGKLVLVTSLKSVQSILNTPEYQKYIMQAIKKVDNTLVSDYIIITSEEKDSYLTNKEPKVETVINDNKPLFNDKYTFDNFVVGSSNNIAKSAAFSVAQNPGNSFNPLFIYGGVGLGKTHILHAIGNYVLSNNKNTNIIYATTEQFVNDYIESLRNNKTDKVYEFRDKYRKADILMLDDVQFLQNKEGSQEALFHTFNDLYQAKKQIVFTSDRHPRDLAGLEERLKSRFQSGLTVDISSPDLETRIAILQKKAYQKNFNISKNIIYFIAEKITSNIREIEGALSKVIFFCQLNNKDCADDLELVMHALKDELSMDTKVLNMDTITDAVCAYYNITKEEIKGSKKTKNIAEARQIDIYLINDMISVPLMSIGQYLGNRDHSTIIYARDKITEQIKSEGRIRMVVKDIQNMINKN